MVRQEHGICRCVGRYRGGCQRDRNMHSGLPPFRYLMSLSSSEAMRIVAVPSTTAGSIKAAVGRVLASDRVMRSVHGRGR